MKNGLNEFVSTPIGAFVVLAIAASLEVLGDSFFQTGLYRSSGSQRAMWFVVGVAVLGMYGLFVNFPQWDFGKLLGGICRAVFCSSAGGGEGAVPAVADDSDPCGGQLDCGRRFGDYLLEGLSEWDEKAMPPGEWGGTTYGQMLLCVALRT